MVQQFYTSLFLISASPDPVTALSQFFYKLVGYLTEDDIMVHRNFYARFRYLIATLPLTDTERRNLDAFRRFIKLHKAGEAAVMQGIGLMKRLLDVATNKEDLSDYDPEYFARILPARDLTNTLRVLCYSWSEPFTHNEATCFTLKAYDLEQLNTSIDIHLHGEELEYIRTLLIPNAVLLIQGVVSAQDGYHTVNDSLVVLEPDFLLDASAIGECFSGGNAHAYIFFLSRLVEDLPGAPALKGSIVGYFLDEMIRNEKADMVKLFLEAQRTHALKAAWLGRTTMQQIYTSIQQEHLPKLQQLVQREQHKELWIEPTYFSTDYGLQGRLDLLAINTNRDVKDIIELKSGSPSSPAQNIAWVNHRMQVVSYDLLLRSTYGSQRQGYNAVFYSRCDTSPYRNIVSDHAEWSQVMHIRNRVVATIYQLAANDFGALTHISEKGISGLPKFSGPQLEKFQLLYEPHKIAVQYYQELLAFTLREMINAKVGHFTRTEEEQQHGFAALWLHDATAKESGFRMMADLKVTAVDEAHGAITLSITREMPHAFREGDLVILYPRTDKGYDCLGQHILKGGIRSLTQDTLTVSVNNKQTAYHFIYSHEYWAIEPDLYERNFWSGVSCLFNVLSCGDRKKRLLLGHVAPAVTLREPRVNNLTPHQQQAVREALSADDYYLLQGPPGTGKTSTFLVNYIRESLLVSSEQIVVLAYTNNAVEEICKAFRAAGLTYLRLGNRYAEDENLFTSLLSDNNADNWRALLRQRPILVCTVSAFQNNWLLLRAMISFRQVVVDEASQLTEADLAGILAAFDKFVLIGDHQQLPATVTQHEQSCMIKTGSVLEQFGLKNLRVSLFERLVQNAVFKGWVHAHGQLTDHYRMHEQIAGLISVYYTQGLKAGREQQSALSQPYTLPVGHALEALTQSRVVFIESEAEAGLKQHRGEAAMVAAVVRALIEEAKINNETAFRLQDIGIITPFRAQIAEIKKHLPAEWLQSGLVVDTVERFQGAQRKVIIFSTTISDVTQAGMVQSLTANGVDRKLLVGISRAEEQVIMLGNPAVLRTLPGYKDFISACEAATSAALA
jgi:DNA replication ATP-dependent helicase Dna2